MASTHKRWKKNEILSFSKMCLIQSLRKFILYELLFSMKFETSVKPGSHIMHVFLQQSYQIICEKYPSFRQRSENTDLVVEISLQPWNVFKPDGVSYHIEKAIILTCIISLSLYLTCLFPLSNSICVDGCNR